MKKNELRIGNLVKVRGKIVKVEQITEKKIGYYKEPRENAMHYARLVDIEPIELTKDVVAKIKLDLKKNYNDYYFYKDGKLVFGCYFSNDYCLVSFYKFMAINRIQLHELQNTYYIITNTELEVEL